MVRPVVLYDAWVRASTVVAECFAFLLCLCFVKKYDIVSRVAIFL